ncbi:MAG: hypothetical protein ABSE08_08455 [Syntrophobacteraceae bacterium]|jgi:hypothetical protein
MFDMPDTGNPVFLQIQNSKKPDQIISVIMSDSQARFETRGLRGFFGLDEIWIERTEFLLSMEEYATLLSFLLETMSAAQDLNLPYSYMDNFEYKGRRYSLIRQNGYRVLTKKDPP